MTNTIEIVNAAVALIIKAALLAARFSGRARHRNLKKLSKMDVDEKDKEIIFLRDTVHQQQMQIVILQKGLQKNNTHQRYTIREKLYILCYMEIFQIARRRVTEHLVIARSTLYRWLHKSKSNRDQRSLPIKHRPKLPPLPGNRKDQRRLGSNSDCQSTGTAKHLPLSFYGAEHSQSAPTPNRTKICAEAKEDRRRETPLDPRPGIPITSGRLTQRWCIAGDCGPFISAW
jgi:hypothetical protein